ncbi:hypothetical protein EDC18_101516 [Natranaerovirga pectinivora]|uniref:Uncharacterized protein n=1 Tax=Natranaerovirga pectinivora TaxID=682400 RepID=A0A4R3MSK6_9FIRM|nr:hypothetical protein [Natranaerovirga pectinivora]TCT17218.1 hypothetical protein EDC18_101516 [Natranaerovirga pectinivora]
MGRYKRNGFRLLIALIIIIILLLSVGIIYGNDYIKRYRFNHVEKIYENVYMEDGYIAEPENVIHDDWLTDFAGGKKEQFIVRIGQVLYNQSEVNKEAYIEIESNNEKIELIANGGSYEYYDITNKIKRKTLNFLTGKRLEGNEVIKDYTEGKNTIVLIIDYDEDGNGTPKVIYCSDDQSFKQPKNNYYRLSIRN